MDEKELSELTRKTAETLFGPPKKGEGAYALWRQFNVEGLKTLKKVLEDCGEWKEEK